MRELNQLEINNVGAGESGGFFESIGNAIDNPYTTIGKFLDGFFSEGWTNDDGTGHYDKNLNVPFGA